MDIKIRYTLQLTDLLEKLPMDKIDKVIQALNDARNKGKQIYIFGNGGSASTALHFTSDLNKGAICEGKPRFKAQCLNGNMVLVTAWANDTNYGNIFEEQLGNFVEPGDVVLVISGSGDSLNTLNAVRLARSREAICIGFIGFNGGQLKDLVDIAVVIPSNNMEQIEDIHLIVCHIIKTSLKDNHE